MPVENRNRRAHVRLTEAEYQALNVAAQTLGVKRARLLRKLLREFLNQEPDLMGSDLLIFREALRQVAAYGNNLNQIARAVNSGQALASLDASFFPAAQAEIRKLRDDWAGILERTRKRAVTYAA